MARYDVKCIISQQRSLTQNLCVGVSTVNVSDITSNDFQHSYCGCQIKTAILPVCLPEWFTTETESFRDRIQLCVRLDLCSLRLSRQTSGVLPSKGTPFHLNIQCKVTSLPLTELRSPMSLCFLLFVVKQISSSSFTLFLYVCPTFSER